MILPVGYALGLVILLMSGELFFVLPGSGNLWGVALGLLVLAGPPLLSYFTAGLEHRLRSEWLVRSATRASVLSLPAAYAVMLGPCCYLDVVDRLAGDRYVGRCLLLLLPLLVAELARAIGEARFLIGATRSSHLRSRLAFVGLFTTPWVGLAVLGDLVSQQRALFVLLAGTTVGLTIGAIVFVVFLGIVLPVLFRFYVGLRDLPEDLSDLGDTAAALGFPARAVKWMDSGMRTVNALLLGPLPWPRYLVVTDGIVAALDRQALRGVVAHEVGHAQAGHPALLLTLFVISPLLLANVAQGFDLESVGWQTIVAMCAIVVVLGWLLLRRVAHRFEHEADVLSAIALGGAEPCIRALERVGQVVQQDPGRDSMLHPSERKRVALLRSFADDPIFRARFTLRGVRLRRVIGGILIATSLGAAWSWHAAWPLERAAFHYHMGDFVGARTQVQQVGSQVPGAQWEWWRRFVEELDAASQIAGDGGDWEALRPRLAEEAWNRGVAALRDQRVAVARPFFALATEDLERSPLRRCMLIYCEALASGDTATAALLRAQMVRLGLPPELRELLVG